LLLDVTYGEFRELDGQHVFHEVGDLLYLETL
jgi:hypothetical protein